MIKLASVKPGNNGDNDSNLTVSALSATDQIKGNASSTNVIIEYSDFQCPACASYHPIVKQFVADSGDKVAFVYRHFPLPQHKNAKTSAAAAEAAGKQGKFWEMHDLIFENQKAWENSAKAEEIFTGYARQLGLNVEQFAADYNSEEIKAKVDADYKSGVKAGVNSTPSFFLNGKKITNPRSYDEFKTLLQQNG
ncbi:MAG: DsbA family protein [Candidatus Paceibacter sp.]|nr:DsbA family protein [Candidatus Paceibacter sp.]